MDILGKVKKIVSEHLDIEEEKITMESTFEGLEADSLDVVELVVSLEQEFDLEIADEEVEKIKSIGDVVNYIENHS